jgi:hypothetical protein
LPAIGDRSSRPGAMSVSGGGRATLETQGRGAVSR